MKAIFLTNTDDFDAPILGGVQICSQEYFRVLKRCVNEIIRIDVHNSYHPIDRLNRKLGFKRYLNHNPGRNPLVLQQIAAHKPDLILINHCQLLRYTKALKLAIPNAKVVLLSHGNQSGDDLYELTSTFGRLQHQGKTSLLNTLFYGADLIMESRYRRHFIDGVITMSEQEVAIEHWLGAKTAFYFPRIIDRDILAWNPKDNRVGFIGTLNHTPNKIALTHIFDWFQANPQIDPPIIRLIGSGEEIGRKFQQDYSFVEYLGALNDSEAKLEIQSWQFFLNPIFWLSRGASMKLKQALSWCIPTITTEFGSRGYSLSGPTQVSTKNSIKVFCETLFECLKSKSPASIRDALLSHNWKEDNESIEFKCQSFIHSLSE